LWISTLGNEVDRIKDAFELTINQFIKIIFVTNWRISLQHKKYVFEHNYVEKNVISLLQAKYFEGNLSKYILLSVHYRSFWNQELISTTCLWVAFTPADLKNTKRQSSNQCFLALLGSLCVKADCKMLVK